MIFTQFSGNCSSFVARKNIFQHGGVVVVRTVRALRRRATTLDLRWLGKPGKLRWCLSGARGCGDRCLPKRGQRWVWFSLKDREFQLERVATIPEACGYDPSRQRAMSVRLNCNVLEPNRADERIGGEDGHQIRLLQRGPIIN